jgi:general secretion pathway protein D
MKKRLFFIIISIAFFSATLFPSLGFGQTSRTRPGSAPGRPGFAGGSDISINFDKAPVIEVIDIMSRVTGKNFIIDPGVQGTVTVIAPKRVPRAEAYGVFESILAMNGFSLVPMGSIIKVVPSRAATQKNIPVRKGRESVGTTQRDQIITQLIPIQHTDAQSVVTVLTPLISRDANITTYSNTNTIIITETASNIDRLLEIIREIDVPGFEEKISIIMLANASADILAAEILQALEPGPSMPGAPAATRTRRRTPAQQAFTGTPASGIKIIPDLRTNSLIIVANEVDTAQIKFLIAELDKATPVEANNIHVYRLKNSLAEDVAGVLTSLAGTTTPAAGGIGGAAPVSGVRTFYKDVSVVADKTTNSLIIIASAQDYAVLKSVIEQLDVMRPQVLVETLIAEVSADFGRDLGIRWFGANPNGDDHGFAGVGQSSGDSLVGNMAKAAITGLPPAIPGGLSMGYFNIDGDVLTAFLEINASESDSDFNVLSAPHLLTLDNEKATINISDNVPFITSVLTDNTGSDDLSQNETFEYRDVGIILEITPHISPDRMVRLEIVQKVNEVASIPASSSTGEVLSEKKREVETTVVVKDRHTLVLGGLMKESDNITISKVPFLGDIPVIGWLFKSKSTTRVKTNLLIFITPSIVANVAESAELTIEKAGEAGDELRDQMMESPTLRRSQIFGGKESGDALPEQLPEALHEAGPK